MSPQNTAGFFILLPLEAVTLDLNTPAEKKKKSLLFRHKGEIKRATNERIKFSMIPIAFSEIQQRDLQLISFFTR